MIMAAHAAIRPALNDRPRVSGSVVTAARVGAVAVVMPGSSQAKSDSPAFSSRSWMRATAARMMNKITERALA